MARRGTEVAPVTAQPKGVAGPRRTRVVIRKVGPWTVFRWSLLFYFCVMLIGLLALFIIFQVLDASGFLDSIGKLLGKAFGVGCPPGPHDIEVDCVMTFSASWIFTRLFLVGSVLVVIWSVINLLIALLYNLVSDVLGGIEMSLVERR